MFSNLFYFLRLLFAASPALVIGELAWGVLTVLPGQEVTITDGAAYGLILTQGHGTLGVHECETPTLLRFGQLSQDEFYVTETAAKNGVRIRNTSRVEPLVMLKHFGPNHPDMPRTKE